MFPRLREREHNLGANLSGGEQQMPAIGRALLTNPDLLILDEATEGLSPLVRQEIWRSLAALKAEGLSLIVVDKDLEALMRLGDRHVVFGRVGWPGLETRSNSARRTTCSTGISASEPGRTSPTASGKRRGMKAS